MQVGDGVWFTVAGCLSGPRRGCSERAPIPMSAVASSLLGVAVKYSRESHGSGARRVRRIDRLILASLCKTIGQPAAATTVTSHLVCPSVFLSSFSAMTLLVGLCDP